MKKIGIKITKELLKKYPNVSFKGIIVSNIENKKKDEFLEKEKEKIVQNLQKVIKNPSEIKIIKAYNKFFKKWNKTVPIEYQLNTTIKNGKIPIQSTLKDALFMVEMKHQCMISGHDLDALKEEIIFDINQHDNDFENIQGKIESLPPGDIILRDNEQVLTSLLHGPGYDDKIEKDTKNVLYLFWYFDKIAEKESNKYLKELSNYIKHVSSKNTKISTIDTKKISTTSEKFTFNPWEVKGDINYHKLVEKFGVSLMKDLPKVFQEELIFRRKIIFSHRDFHRILESIRDKKKFVMMTGLMPTGKFHLGHALVAKQFPFYQKLGAKIYIAVADIEAYNARQQSLEDSRKIAIEEYITNYIALGLKPENVEIYFQSDRSNNSKKSNAYYRLQNLLARYATFNEFKAVYGDINPGKMLSSLLQASDMLHAQLPEFEGDCPVVVPVGIDQDPHLRIARDISKRTKGIKFTQLSSTYHHMLPGLRGVTAGKMSASDPNSFIALTDNEKTVKNKINKYAFSGGQATLEEHKKKGGNPDIDVSFQYLKMFFEEDDKKLEEIYNNYKSGKMTTGELKKYTIDKINKFLAEHQKKREKAKKDIDKFILNQKPL